MPPRPFLFSRRDYCLSLPHVGEPHPCAGLGTTLLARPIPGSGRADLAGPWPYVAAPPPASAAGTLAALRREGFVSLTMVLRPDTAPGEIDALRAALGDGAAVAPLKEHYIHDPALPLPQPRPRTRAHLGTAARHWQVEPLDRAGIPSLCSDLQEQLARRRQLSDFARVLPEHFQMLAGLGEIEALAVVDGDGPAAVLVAARTGGATHLLHFLTTPRVIPTAGSYLLWHEAVRHWSREGCVYLGGAPGSLDGPGIARFKARWANRTAPAFLLSAVLDADAYQGLAARCPASSFFPAYRSAGA